MKRIHSTGRAPVPVLAFCLGAVALLAACASDPGEKVVKAPFPDLAEVPPRPEPSTTAAERAALRQQLESRRDEVNRAADSLLRGGTESVPVALDTRLPDAPLSGAVAPPPLPDGLPPPPERPRIMPDDGPAKQKSQPPEKDKIKAPAAGQSPAPRAPGEKEEEAGSGEDGATEAAEDDGDG